MAGPENKEKQVVEIVVDDSKWDRSIAGFSSKSEKQLNDLASDIVDSFVPIPGVLKKALNFAPYALGAAAAGAMIKKAFDFTLQAENIREMDVRFEALARNAGISSDAIRSGMRDASEGMLSTEAIIESSTRALIQMGSNASELPALFRIAKEATDVFGGTVKDNFEQINHAIATGQTKGLKSLGLIIDQQEAYRAYANRIGVATATLSDHAKQQAMVQAVLNQSEKAFAGQIGYVKVADDSWNRFKASISDTGRFLTSLFGGTFGSVVRPALESLAKGANDFRVFVTAGLGEGIEKARAKVEYYNQKVAEQRKLIDDLGASYERLKGRDPFVEERARIAWEKANQTLLALKLSASSAATELAKMEGKSGAKPVAKTEPVQDPRAAQAADVAYQNQLLSIQQSINSERMKSALTAGQLTAAYENQISLVSTQFELEKQRVALSDSYDPQQKANLEVMIEEQKAQRILAIRREMAMNETIAAQMSTSTWQSFADGFAGISEETRAQLNATSDVQEREAILTQERTKRMSAAFRSFGDQVKNTIGSGVVNSFAAMGEAMALGQDGMAAFGNAMLSVLGDIAIQAGSMFIQLGIAKAIASLGTDPSAFALIAAGGALAAIGGAIKAVSGGSKGASAGAVANSPTGSQGGGIVVNGSPEYTEPSKRGRASVVNVNVQGHIFNNRETALEISNMLNDAWGASAVAVGARA